MCPPNATLIEFTKLEQKAILRMHNKIRNFIASGNHSLYNSADRMAFMEWDKSLAIVASFNVRSCEFQHDSCRNTSKFEANLLPLPFPKNNLPLFLQSIISAASCLKSIRTFPRIRLIKFA